MYGDTVVAGARGDDGFKGSVYVFTEPLTGVGWTDATETAKLTASDCAANDYFGISISVDGGTVVVGAHLDDDNRVDSGSAYVFTEPNSGWTDVTETAKLTASDWVADDVFGYLVAVDGDTAVAGAEGDDGDKGSVYVFTRQSGARSRVAKLTAFERADDDHFGYSVAVEGDTVVVGAYRDDDNGSDSG